jgi:hypothetical protein
MRTLKSAEVTAVATPKDRTTRPKVGRMISNAGRFHRLGLRLRSFCFFGSLKRALSDCGRISNPGARARDDRFVVATVPSGLVRQFSELCR